MADQERPGPAASVPADQEAEEQVVGSLLVDDLAIGQIAGLLKAEDFFSVAPRTVFAAMLALHEQGRPSDISLVRAELEQRGQLDDLGGASRLVSYLNAAPTAVNVLHYAGLVADRAQRRRLIQAAARVAEVAYEAPTAEQAVQQAAEAVAKASESRMVGRVVDFDVLIGQAWDEVTAAVDQAQDGEVVTPGVPTGIADLDLLTGGIRPGDLALLAARPSMGKTAMAVQVAVHVAGRTGPVLVFSLEMPGRDLAGRAIWQRSRVSSQMARRGLLDPDQIQRVAGAAGDLSPLPIRIDDTPALPVSVLAARARAAKAERGRLALVVVDYLQLVKGTPRRDGNRVAEVSEISAALKALARDLECPVLALSQLNRAVEHRAEAKPNLSDLRDSGSLEQDADMVFLLWREAADAVISRLAVAKNRNGPTGAFEMVFDRESTRFDPLSQRDAPNF